RKRSEKTKRENEARKRRIARRLENDQGTVHSQPRLLNDREQWHPDFYGSNLN
ncbi:MAG: hypothetical protein ACI87E_004191, partial [Mariniblastus sp.]